VQPLVLEPGITYLLAAEVGPGDFYFDQTASVAAFAKGIVHGVGKATPVGNPEMPDVANTSTFPISNDKDAYYGPNLKILPAPPVEPGSELGTHVAVDIVDLYNGRREPADDVGLGFAGYVFSVESEMMVTHLGSFDINKDGLEEEVQVRLFNWDRGDVLVQGDVPVSSQAETTGLFDSYFTEIDPVTLHPGMTYAIVMDVTKLREYYVHSSGTVASWASGLIYRFGIRTEPDASSIPSEPSVFIVSDHRDAYFGPNFKFSYVPEAFTIDVPLTRAVFQRNAQNTADVPIAGTILDRMKIDEMQFRSFLTSESTADDAGWDVPWGIAIVGFHPQSSEQAEADVRAGQQIVIDTVDNVFKGPNTDLLGSSYRSDTVHFNSLGLSEHAKGWLDAIYERFPDLR